MKRTLILTAGALAHLLTACGGSGEKTQPAADSVTVRQPSGPVPAENPLTRATTVNLGGHTFHVEIRRFVDKEQPTVKDDLDQEFYDNGVEVTEERAKSYDFSEPYAYIHTALAVRSDNTDITSFEDLAGKTTANSIASTYMTLAESYGAEVLGVDTLDETIQMLLAGRVDATLNADVSFYDYLNVHPDAAFKLVAETPDASHVCIPVRKGGESDTLLAAINEAIDALRADGTLAEISEKYFGSDISSEE